MTQVLESFLREGVHRYAEASATIQAFQTAIEKRLQSILRDRRDRNDWTTFVPSASHSIESWHSWGITSPHVTAWIKGKVEGSLAANLAIGIWWNAPYDNAEEKVIFHANFEDADPRILLKNGDPDGPMFSFLADGATRLCLHPKSELDFDHDFNVLITALQARIG